MNTNIIGDYILEVSWGCPSDKYPLNGLFQFDQAKALHDAGENIVFLALDMRSFRRIRKWGYNRFEKDGIPVIEYNFPWGPFSPVLKYRSQDFAFNKAIKRIEKEFGKPKCIHVHCCQQAISVTDYCKEKAVPYVITEHITPLDEGKEIEKRKEKALKGAKTVISVSKALARDVKNTYGADSVVIPNIVDLSEFRYSDKTISRLNDANNTQDKTFEFLSAASVNYGKGFDVLIKSFSQFVKNTSKDSHLTIMGDGPELSNIKNLATELGVIDRITFAGEYVRKQFAEKLTHCDCFVLPSRSETFGIVYIEALATGTPVIATKCGGPEDFVDDSNGYLVPVDDVDALSDAMIRMVSERTTRFDEETLRHVAEDCREKFSAEAVARKLQSVICS